MPVLAGFSGDERTDYKSVQGRGYRRHHVLVRKRQATSQLWDIQTAGHAYVQRVPGRQCHHKLAPRQVLDVRGLVS